MKVPTRRFPGSARAFATCLGLGLAVPATPAQTPATPSPEDTLARLVREYETQRASIERPLLTAYAQRLSALHEALEKRRDPGAASVASELAAVQAQLSRATTSAAAPPGRPDQAAADKPPTGPLELPGPKARTTGGATAGEDQNSPVLFAGKDSAAEWTLPKLPTGRYRLLWRIACEVGAGATVRLTIDGQPPRTLEVQPTTASGDALVANLGEFTATTAPAWLRVEVLSLPGRPRKTGPSFSLARVILIPPGVTMPGL
jgi:hypothetical protein